THHPPMEAARAARRGGPWMRWLVTEAFVITIENERAPSWNGSYAGMHWSKRTALAHEKHLLVLALLPLDIEPFEVPVDIYVLATYRTQPVDSDNVVAKLYIDGLKGRVIQDDNSQWVCDVTTRAVLADE